MTPESADLPMGDPEGGEFPGFIGISRQDITPPPGIYALLGAATHDIAEGVHRPLTLPMTIERTFADEPTPLVITMPT